ncbi:MAG: GNAT family N-acetyltransferase [Cyclobacteriaceae bacterium]
MKISIMDAGTQHLGYAEQICDEYATAAAARGTGIARRQPEYVRKKIADGHAVVALEGDKLAGFCYIETWSHNKFIANSGLMVLPEYRMHGLAKKIKQAIFKLSRKKYPQAKIFGITTSLAVMKINSQLGYKPVTFSELSQDDEFWKGCQSCKNYDILQRNECRMCLCTGLLYDPVKASKRAWLKDNMKKLTKPKQAMLDTNPGQGPLQEDSKERITRIRSFFKIKKSPQL